MFGSETLGVTSAGGFWEGRVGARSDPGIGSPHGEGAGEIGADGWPSSLGCGAGGCWLSGEGGEMVTSAKDLMSGMLLLLGPAAGTYSLAEARSDDSRIASIGKGGRALTCCCAGEH